MIACHVPTTRDVTPSKPLMTPPVEPEPSPSLKDDDDVPDRYKSFDNGVGWSTVPKEGLPELRYPTNLRLFGRFPELAYALVNTMGEVGIPVPGLYAFDPKEGRWRALGFFGDPRIVIDPAPIGEDRWVLVRRGYGVAGNVRVKVAVVGAGIDDLEVQELPCRSETSGHVEPAANGGWAFRCGRPDRPGDYLLNLKPPFDASTSN